MRWTVRGVPPEVRKAAADAADRGKVPVGAWLCAAVELALRAEREPVILMPPLADTRADMADGAARLAVVERAVAAAVSLAGSPEVPTGFRRRANRLLREALPVRGVAGKQALLIDGAA